MRGSRSPLISLIALLLLGALLLPLLQPWLGPPADESHEWRARLEAGLSELGEGIAIARERIEESMALEAWLAQGGLESAWHDFRRGFHLWRDDLELRALEAGETLAAWRDELELRLSQLDA